MEPEIEPLVRRPNTLIVASMCGPRPERTDVEWRVHALRWVHVREDGSEISYPSPPKDIPTLQVKIVAIGDGYIVEQTGAPKWITPPGKGWVRFCTDHDKHNDWRRRRKFDPRNPAPVVEEPIGKKDFNPNWRWLSLDESGEEEVSSTPPKGRPSIKITQLHLANGKVRQIATCEEPPAIGRGWGPFTPSPQYGETRWKRVIK